ncbi:MAG: hypothetical protein WAK33_01680 [Silvibacterium sp.]
MHKSAPAVFAVSLLVATIGFAKDKNKGMLPSYVLRARTVAVIIDPNAGISLDDPQANQVAQKDVEMALESWGRLDPIVSTQAADLIIVVRRGHQHVVDQTITNPRQNDRAGNVNPTDDGVGISAQQGRPPSLSGPGSADDSSPHTQTEIGATDDSFIVYEGGVDRPLDTPPAWRYTAKGALLPHTVPAVEQFKKAIAQAEKAAAKTP